MQSSHLRVTGGLTLLSEVDVGGLTRMDHTLINDAAVMNDSNTSEVSWG